MNKKASFADMFYIALIGFIVAIASVSGYMFLSKVNDKFQSSTGIAQEGKDIVSSTQSRFVSWFDGIFIVIIVLLTIMGLVFAWNVPSHVVFYPLTIIVYIALILITATLGNVFYEFAANAEITSYASDFTIIPLVMNNFLQVMLVIGFLIAVVLFSKSRGDTGAYYG